MRRLPLLASVPAIAFAAMLGSTPVLAADIVAPEPVAEANLWYVNLFGGIKFGEDWDDSIDCHNEFCDESLDLTIETDNGWRISGAVGFLFNETFAVEGELSYMRQDLDSGHIDSFSKDGHTIECDDCDFGLDGDVSIFTGMVNFVAGFPVSAGLRPYIGVGAGFAHVSLDADDDFSDDDDDFFDNGDTSFALQGFVGLDFVLSENMALGVRGRLLHIGDLEADGAFDFLDCDHDLDPDLIPSIEVGLTIGL
jgi:opacity protein-like surface antigen